MTPNIGSRHLPSDSARTGYITEAALFISLTLISFVVSVDVNSIQKTLIIPQGAILLGSWRARKKKKKKRKS